MQGKLSEVSNPNISDAGLKNVTENKKKSRKPAVIAVASVAAVAVLAGGGWFVWKTYANHELAEARQACVEASESYRKAADSYSGLVDGDAATASQITVKQVADAKTVDALAEALKANEPDVVACVADSKADYESKTSLIEKNTGWYGKHEKSLEEAVKAVNDSKLEKTVSDAERLLKDSDGKVADVATRDELSKAIKAKDADAIAAASKKVNDSVTAKTKADEEAQRKAEEEAAAQAAAEAAAACAAGAVVCAAVVFGSPTVVHALVFRRFDIEWRRFQQRAGLRSKQRRSRMHDRLPSALKRWIDSPLIWMTLLLKGPFGVPFSYPQPSGKMSNPTRQKPWLHSRWMTETNPISTFVDGRSCEVFGRDLFCCTTPPWVGSDICRWISERRRNIGFQEQ